MKPLLTVILSVVLAGATGCEAASNRLEIGGPAPEYGAVTLAGDSVHLGDLKGKAVLLNVWATWCAPCRAEIPALQTLHEIHSERGLELVGVSVDGRNEGENIQRFVDEFGVTYPIWHDPADVVITRFQIIGVPATFVIDRKGTVLWRHMGPLEADDVALNVALEQALATE